MCTEVDDGYEFTYTPMAPGDYLINIKYCNVTIAGCPTKAKITGTSAKLICAHAWGFVLLDFFCCKCEAMYIYPLFMQWIAHASQHREEDELKTSVHELFVS